MTREIISQERESRIEQTVGEESAAYFCHPAALIEPGATIGRGTRIWAFVHVVTGVMIGADCNVCDHVFIEDRVVIGDRVTIKCGVSLWNGLVVEDDVFIGPNACFTNDMRPRSRKYLTEFPVTRLKQGCTVGANATIMPGLTLGRWAMIGAGAVVTRDVPDFGLVLGNPARLEGWVCPCGEKLTPTPEGQLDCVCGTRFQPISGVEIREAGKCN